MRTWKCIAGGIKGSHDSSGLWFKLLSISLAAILALSLVPLTFDQTDAEITASWGSGTEEDPYGGTVIGTVPDYETIYVEVGSYCEVGSGFDMSQGSIPGLSYDYDTGMYVGTITGTGHITFGFEDVGGPGGGMMWGCMIEAVEPPVRTPELVFESNPASGDIVYVGS